jgi:uncharacterized protein (TIGR03086 family)
MSEVSERYDRLSAAFAAKAAAVSPDRWAAPSPCEDWTAREVVGHVVDSHATFLGLIGEPAPDGPSVESDPSGAFDAARAAVLERLEDPAVATRTYEGQLGVRTFEWAVDRFLSFDLVVHGWDLARATGQDEAIPDEELERVSATAGDMGDMGRAPGVLGPPLDPPPGADEQTRVLAFLGRKAWT